MVVMMAYKMAESTVVMMDGHLVEMKVVVLAWLMDNIKVSTRAVMKVFVMVDYTVVVMVE